MREAEGSAVLNANGKPACSACGGELQHIDQHQCPYRTCRAVLRDG
jgi:hypothetical protein